jgi:hypothetical protein
VDVSRASAVAAVRDPSAAHPAQVPAAQHPRVDCSQASLLPRHTDDRLGELGIVEHIDIRLEQHIHRRRQLLEPARHPHIMNKGCDGVPGSPSATIAHAFSVSATADRLAAG